MLLWPEQGGKWTGEKDCIIGSRKFFSADCNLFSQCPINSHNRITHLHQTPFTMHTSLFLALTFFASIDTIAATPAQKGITAALTRCEASRPDCATVVLRDGARIIVLQSPEMAVEVRASKKKGTTAATVVAGLASRIAGKRNIEKQA
jgi:hypothetical protein